MSDEREGILSRRFLLQSAVLIAAAGVPRLAAAQQKIDPKLVQYQDKPKGTQECDNCLHFVPPDQCKMVSGKINPKGWCALYAAKPK